MDYCLLFLLNFCMAALNALLYLKYERRISIVATCISWAAAMFCLWGMLAG